MTLPPNAGQSGPSVLVVDDTPSNLQMLAEMLKAQGYKARPVSSGELALQVAAESPPDLILLDVNMPELDGYEVCRLMKQQESLRGVPIIFISALSETMDKTRAFSAGGVDYVTKPFQMEEVKARIATHLKLHALQRAADRQNQYLEQLVCEQVREISSAQQATILALAKLAEYRDEETGTHIVRVQRYCQVLAETLAEQEGLAAIDEAFVENIFHASSLHDIGKVAVPDSILLKSGRLTEEEFEVMKGHTVLGAETLAVIYAEYPNGFLRMGMEMARSHHERWDGSGYPDGLCGEAIPLSARITMLADQYDALRSARPYKPPFDAETSYRIIVAGDGRTRQGHFDPRVLRAFKSVAGRFDRIHAEYQSC